MHHHPATSANVTLTAAKNATFNDSIQFDPPVPGVVGPAWTLTNQNFQLDIKANWESAVALLSISSAAGQIVVDDTTQRILHFNVPDSIIQAALIPGCYIYDFIMFDGAAPPVRVQLMHGEFFVGDGVTGG